MKTKKHIFRAALLIAAFSLGLSGIIIHQNAKVTKVEAAQHTDNFDLYTYSGSYYNNFDFNASSGLNGNLRKALTTLTEPKGWYEYSGTGSNTLSEVLQKADEDPTDSTKMIYLYTRDSVTKNAASSWNREHVWPQSLSGGCWGKNQGGADLLHIRPTYENTNSSRNNDKYCDVNKSSPRTMKNTNYVFGYGPGGTFEPLDATKGDVARIIMYMWTAYNDFYDDLPLITGNNNPSVDDVFESYDTLLKWHTQDKPDVLEGNRNNYCQTSVQQNRNPFVDHPELAWKIFGDSASASVKNACMATYPDDGYTPGPVTNSSFTKVTDFTDGKKYIIAAKDYQNSSTEYYLPAGTATVSSNPAAVQISSLDTLTEDKAWTASVDSSSPKHIVFSNTVNNTTYYLTATNKAQGISISETSTGYWVYDGTGLQFSDDGSRYLASYNNGTFRYYTAPLNSGSATGQSMANIFYEYNPAVAPTAVVLNETSLELEVGQTHQLAANVDNVTWSSNNAAVTVTQNGLVTAVSAGSATITASSGQLTPATCSVTVSAPISSVVLPTNGLEINFDNLSLSNYTTYALNHNRSVVVGNFSITLDPNSVDAVTRGAAPYNTDNLGVNCMQFKSGGRDAILVNTRIQAAKKATIVLYTWGYATQTSAYLPSFKIGSSNTAILPNETQGGTINATGVDTGLSYTSSGSNPTTKKLYSFTLTYDLSSLSNSTLTLVSANSAATYVGSVVIDNNSGQVEDNPDNYLNNATSYATLHGKETGTTTSDLNFASQGYENGEEITNITVDSNIAAVCDTGTGTTAPAYYNTGSSLRLYGGNTMTLSPKNGINSKIVKVEFTIASGSYSSITVSDTSLTSNIWTGDASSVEFKNKDTSGHVRIADISVTYYTGTYSVDNVSIRFGASITKANWNNIKNHDGWSITDYGVMMAKKTTLTGYGENKNTVEKAFRNKGASYVSIVNKMKGEGAIYADPYLSGNTTYSFTARLSFNSTTGFDTVVCARPFVKVGSEYYFIGDEDIEFSVNSLASYYIANPTYMGGLSLSNKALTYLSTAH